MVKVRNTFLVKLHFLIIFSLLILAACSSKQSAHNNEETLSEWNMSPSSGACA